MSSSSERHGRNLSKAMTTSHAAQNEASGSAIQFNNAEVARQTTATYSQEMVRTDDNRVGDGHWQVDQGRLNIVNPKFNFTQSVPYQAGVTTPTCSPRPGIDLPLTDNDRACFMEENLLPGLHGSKSGGDISDTQHSLGLPTRISANSSAHTDLNLNSLAQTNKSTIDAITTRISTISDFYDDLPKRFGRLRRVPEFPAMRKDLTAQKTMFSVAVEDGELISCLERTIQSQRTNPHAVSGLLPENADIENIRSHLDHIHKLLHDVDQLSYKLMIKEEVTSLPFRPRNQPANPKPGRPSISSSAATPRGIVKRRQNNIRTRKSNNPLPTLISTIRMLTTDMEQLHKQCQRLQPFQYDYTLEVTSIPEDIELTKAVAVRLFKALCQVCPNKEHIHQVLFSSATSEQSYDHDGDTTVKFNLAFECDEDSRTWFIVQSTMKGQSDEEMDVEQFEADARPEIISKPAFSHHQEDSRDATEQPNARFCLQYYKQGTDDRAMELKQSDRCEHVVFYPDEKRLDALLTEDQPVPLRQYLEENELKKLQMIQIAKMLSEAVLKFHSEDWMHCKWDLDNVLIYEMPDGSLEPHLRCNLWNPQSVDTMMEHVPRSQKMSHVVSQLGVLLGNLALGRDTGSANYEEVRSFTGSNVYAEIFQTCHDMSRNENNLGDQIMQAKFHAQVVAKLTESEDHLRDLEE